MPNVVSGIAPGPELPGLEAALAQAGFPLGRLQIVSVEDPGLGGVRGPLVGDELPFGTVGTGTAVPGLTGPPTLAAPQASFNDELLERLADLEIPDDQLANYAEALESGRSVVAYFAEPAGVETISALFRAAGLAKVRTF